MLIVPVMRIIIMINRIGELLAWPGYLDHRLCMSYAIISAEKALKERS